MACKQRFNSRGCDARSAQTPRVSDCWRLRDIAQVRKQGALHEPAPNRPRPSSSFSCSIQPFRGRGRTFGSRPQLTSDSWRCSLPKNRRVKWWGPDPSGLRAAIRPRPVGVQARNVRLTDFPAAVRSFGSLFPPLHRGGHARSACATGFPAPTHVQGLEGFPGHPPSTITVPTVGAMPVTFPTGALQ